MIWNLRHAAPSEHSIFPKDRQDYPELTILEPTYHHLTEEGLTPTLYIHTPEATICIHSDTQKTNANAYLYYKKDTGHYTITAALPHTSTIYTGEIENPKAIEKLVRFLKEWQKGKENPKRRKKT